MFIYLKTNKYSLQIQKRKVKLVLRKTFTSHRCSFMGSPLGVAVGQKKSEDIREAFGKSLERVTSSSNQPHTGPVQIRIRKTSRKGGLTLDFAIHSVLPPPGQGTEQHWREAEDEAER